MAGLISIGDTLGRELQSLAARKVLAINLAWEFIQEHRKAR